MTTLDEVAELAGRDHGLAVVSTLRADGSLQASVVNVGVLADPLGTGQGSDGLVLAFVTYGKVKLANLRHRPQIAVTVTVGWQWATVEGRARLVGPDDPYPAVDSERLRLLLREVFVAAGGSHEDWSEYDRVMAEQRRTVVLVTPARVYSN